MDSTADRGSSRQTPDRDEKNASPVFDALVCGLVTEWLEAQDHEEELQRQADELQRKAEDAHREIEEAHDRMTSALRVRVPKVNPPERVLVWRRGVPLLVQFCSADFERSRDEPIRHALYAGTFDAIVTVD